MQKQIFTIIVFFLISNNIVSQNNKNNFEIGLLGNIGFINLGYNREIVAIDKFIIAIGAKIGYVPGSQESESSAIPNFIHLNLGPAALLSVSSSKFGAGMSYSKILIGSDEFDVRNKSNYNRILGDLNYAYFFDKTRNGRTGVKLSFMPILYDDGAEDVQNIPVKLALVFEF